MNRGHLLKLVKRDGDFIIKRQVRSEEIIMRGKEGGESDGSVFHFKAAGGANMIFIGSIESFVDLFKMSVQL